MLDGLAASVEMRQRGGEREPDADVVGRVVEGRLVLDGGAGPILTRHQRVPLGHELGGARADGRGGGRVAGRPRRVLGAPWARAVAGERVGTPAPPPIS